MIIIIIITSMRPSYWNYAVKLYSLPFKVTKKTGLEEIQVPCLLAERGDSTHKAHIYMIYSEYMWSNGKPMMWKVHYNMPYNISVNEDNLIILRGQTICMSSCQNMSFIECKCYINQVNFFPEFIF